MKKTLIAASIPRYFIDWEIRFVTRSLYETGIETDGGELEKWGNWPRHFSVLVWRENVFCYLLLSLLLSRVVWTLKWETGRGKIFVWCAFSTVTFFKWGTVLSRQSSNIRGSLGPTFGNATLSYSYPCPLIRVPWILFNQRVTCNIEQNLHATYEN